MEIEVDGKELLRWILAVLLVASAVFVGLHERGKAESLLRRLEAVVLHRAGKPGVAGTTRAKGEEGTPVRTTLQASASPTPVEFSAPGKPTVVFEDLSTKWDWDVNEECMPELLEWLQRDKWLKGKNIKKLVVGLVDEKAPEKLREGPKGQEYDLVGKVALPEGRTPKEGFDNIAASSCTSLHSSNAKSKIHCYVAPQKWSGDYKELSSVIIVAPLTALEQIFRPKTRDAWREYSKEWGFSNYQPLVKKEDGKWYTDCLEVRPQG